MSRFDDLLADAFAQKAYAAIVEPYDPATGQTVALYLSDRGLVTGAASEPPHRWFEPRLITALNFERHLFRQGRLGGRSIPGFGALELNNADGGLDGWRGYAFDGRRVRVFLGGPGFAFEEYGTIFDGTAEQIEFDDGVVKLRLRDLQSLFEIDIQQSTYDGSAGAGGGDALKGKPKPLVYGQVSHLEPLLVDAATLLYQVHDGAIEDVDAVYDQGIALTRVGSSPSAGQYTVDTSAGTFQLGASPAGTVTADVRGDKSGGIYVDTVGGIVRRIAATRAGLDDPADLDTESFAAMAAVDATVGIAIAGEQDILSVLDQLVDSVGAHYGFDRSGRLGVGRVTAPSGSALQAFTETEILELSREATALPIWRQRIGFRRYWRTLSGSDLAGAVSPTARQDLAEEYRIEEASDPAVRTVHLLAGPRLLELFSAERDLLRLKVKAQPFVLELGDTVTVRYPRYGLSDGRNFVIVGMVEDSAVNEVTLDLWG
jgi:hypothetical protein